MSAPEHDRSRRSRRRLAAVFAEVTAKVGGPAAVERWHAREIAAVPYLRWVPDGHGGWRLAGDYAPLTTPA